MRDIALKVEGLGKRYRIGAEQAPGMHRYKSLRDSLVGMGRHPMQALRSTVIREPMDESNSFWALQDINIEVEKGEVVGIIGRNGAGKSTLLKILSRITKPTVGHVALYGRVGSLLEVGTGFHAELTGRENVYLNGAILGMTRAEVQRRFDEIVAFSEVEKFIDTAVKHYSSGMYMRLAFAVAAHLEPEILIVDEVLAVGDASFQMKCLGKMKDVGRTGRTVIFVSHDMRAIQSLCGSVVLLTRGSTTGVQTVGSAIASYRLQSQAANRNHALPIRTDDVSITHFNLSQDGHSADEYNGDSPLDVDIAFDVHKHLSVFRIGIFLKSAAGDLIARSLIADWNPDRESMPAGRYVCKGQIPKGFLAGGSYIVELHCSRFGIVDYSFNELISVPLMIRPPRMFNAAHIGEQPFGVVLLDHQWRLDREP